MGKKKKSGRGKRSADWAEVKRRCRLSQQDVEMAKELGLSPRSLIKNIPNRSQPWKAPVKYWIRDLYEEKQSKASKKRRKEEEKPASESETQPGAESPPDAEHDLRSGAIAPDDDVPF